MAKRFIDNNIFKKNFVRGLKGPSKLLWIYLFCDCDNAGVWEIDLEIASIYTGFPVSMTELKKFGDKIVIFDQGRKIFIPEFITFQYGPLNPNNPAHKGVISELIKYQLINENLKGPLKPLPSTLKGAKDMDKDMDMDKEGGMGGANKPVDNTEEVKAISWRDDFEVYKSGLMQVYDQIKDDAEFIKGREKYFPNLDISLSLEKAVNDFWATEAGWKHKKKKRGEINWKSTLTKALDLPSNQVRKQHANNKQSKTGVSVEFEGNKGGTFL